MEDVWKHHFRYYDLFQNNSDRYVKTLKLNAKELEDFHKILDGGAGTGNLTLELLKQGHEVVAVDLDDFSIELLKEKCADFLDKLKILKMDVQELDFEDEFFDGVVSIFVLSFVENSEKYFSEVYRVLKPAGKLTISSWAPVEDSWIGIMDLLEEELKEKKLLPKYQKEWDYIEESSGENLKKVLQGPSLKETEEMLRKVGFKNLQEFDENPFGKYAYSLSCEK